MVFKPELLIKLKPPKINKKKKRLLNCDVMIFIEHLCILNHNNKVNSKWREKLINCDQIIKLIEKSLMDGWIDGWMGGWMGGRQSLFKYCLQRSEIIWKIGGR